MKRWREGRSLVIAIVLLAGCGQGDFPTSPVRGRVLCDGQPVAGVRVFFEPLATGSTALVGKQAIGMTEPDGTYVLTTYNKGDGAVVGKHRVRVGAPGRDERPDFQCACVTNSERDLMEVEISKSGPNEFEIVLPKKTGRERPSLDDREEEEEE